MRKNAIKIAAVLFALVIALSLFASCGQKSTTIVSEGWEDESGYTEESSSQQEDVTDSSENTVSQTSSQNKNSSTQQENSKKEEAPSKDKDGSYNLKGATITLSGWGTNGLKPDPSSSTYKQETKLIEDIKKKFNCKINYKTINDSMQYYGAFTTATMAGTRFADIVAVPGDQGFPNAALNGYVHCLDNYFDWNSAQWIDSLTNKALKLNNKRYYLAVATNTTFHNGEVTWFNPTLFERFGVDDPQTLVKKNNWNWNTFREVAKKMTRKDGTTQYYGLATTNIMNVSNGAEFVTIKADGSRKLNIDDPAYIESIQFIYDLYNVDKVIPEANGTELFKSGYVAMHHATIYGFFGYEGFKMTYAPIGPRMKDYNYADAYSWLFVIPRTVKEPMLPAVCDIMTEYTSVQKWRQTPQEMFEAQLNDEISVETAVDIHNRSMRSTYFSSYYPWAYSKIKWSDYGIREQKSPQSFIASVKATGQAEIDVLWDKLKNLK